MSKKPQKCDVTGGKRFKERRYLQTSMSANH